MAFSAKRDSFYVTCTSNKSRQFYPNNTTSSFITRLSEPIVLDNSDRRWKVGVSSFTYSQAINNFGSECSDTRFYWYNGGRVHEVPIPDQHVTSTTEMITALNDAITTYANEWNAKIFQGDQWTIDFFKRGNKRAKRSLITFRDQLEDFLNEVILKFGTVCFLERITDFVYFAFHFGYLVRNASHVWDMVRTKIVDDSSLTEYDQDLILLLKQRQPFLHSLWESMQEKLTNYASQLALNSKNQFDGVLQMNEIRTEYRSVREQKLKLHNVPTDVVAKWQSLSAEFVSSYNSDRLFFVSTLEAYAIANLHVQKLRNRFSVVKTQLITEKNVLRTLVNHTPDLSSKKREEMLKLILHLSLMTKLFLKENSPAIFEFSNGSLDEIADIVTSRSKRSTTTDSDLVYEELDKHKKTVSVLLNRMNEYITERNPNDRLKLRLERYSMPEKLWNKIYDGEKMLTSGVNLTTAFDRLRKHPPVTPSSSDDNVKKSETEDKEEEKGNPAGSSSATAEKFISSSIAKSMPDFVPTNLIYSSPTADQLIRSLTPTILVPKGDPDGGEHKKSKDADGGDTKKVSSFTISSEMRFDPQLMYGLSRSDYRKRPRMDPKVFWEGKPLEHVFLKFEEVENMITLASSLPDQDFAFSPVLRRMIGFQDHDQLTLERMKQRIAFRQCLFSTVEQDDFSAMLEFNEMRKKIEGKDNFFSEFSLDQRFEFYTEHGIDVELFTRKFKELAESEGYNNVSEYVSKKLVTSTEFKKLIESVFHDDQFTFLDYVVNMMIKENPFDKRIFGSKEKTLSPWDLVFVYTNIIEPENVDDKRLRVLEMMPIRSVAERRLDQIEFSNTHYKTVDVDVISDIEILIATAYGTPVPFRYGPATIQLHFRRV